ncbi:hypothetical protein HA466_0014380 [Hirschfeldia incana]|nr:hypothetical protein HA466_0014380 [Hirschfeldia incana]
MESLKMKSSSSSKTLAANSKKRRGPYLPNSILKIIATHKRPLNSDDEEVDPDDENGVELYEYEEGIPEEESRKNNRYGRLHNYEFKLPDDFEDEDVESEDDEEAEGYDDDDRHTRMLQALTGMPSAAFNRESKSKPVLFTEAYPEGEFNPTRDVLKGKNILIEEDFLAPLKGIPGYHKISRQISRMRKDTKHVVHAPLPKPERERLERKAVKGLVDEEFSKWVHLVKKNREAPTLYFINQDVNLGGNSTVGAIASEFRPRTEFEMRMASVLNDHEVSMEDHVKDHNNTARMRSLLFRHEQKSKQIKKNKSKLYHRLKNKDLRNSALRALMDPELAMKQEARRVEERITSRHKNKGKWAKRMGRLGLNVKYDGTLAAIAEQLQMHAILSKKMNSMRDGTKAKEKTLEALEDDEVLNSGLMSLPFMTRAMKKRNEEANEDAKRASRSMKTPKESKKDSYSFYDNSDSDNDMNGIEDARDIASPSRRNTGTIIETEVSLKESRDEVSEDSESEGEQMVDEIFVIPCQAELINRAFAGDNVVDEFDKDKQEVLNQEVPEPVKPLLLPGWGLWTNKKAEKLHTDTPPFPYTSKEVFEHSMRVPIGPEFNPSTILGDLNRPEVVKKNGVIIKPVKFEEVNPNKEVDDEHTRNRKKPRLKKKTSKRQSKAK